MFIFAVSRIKQFVPIELQNDFFGSKYTFLCLQSSLYKYMFNTINNLTTKTNNLIQPDREPYINLLETEFLKAHFDYLNYINIIHYRDSPNCL